MDREFTIRFYRLRDAVMCDRAGLIASGDHLEHAATLDEARQFSRDFVDEHPALGCLIYRPDGGFALRMDGNQPVAKPKAGPGRSCLLACAHLIPAAALVTWDAANNFGLILPTLLATLLLYVGLFKAVDAIFALAGQDEQ